MMTIVAQKPLKVAETMAKIAAVEFARGLRPAEGERKLEERVIEAPPERSVMEQESQILNQIRARQANLEWLKGDERAQAAQEIRELADRYRSITQSKTGSIEEVGVEIKRAPAIDRIASRIPGLNMVADPRDREVHIIKETKPGVSERIDERDLERMEEGQEKAAEILGRIRITKDPGEVAVLVNDLSELEREHGADVLKNAEVGSFARRVETEIGAEARSVDSNLSKGAESLGKAIEEKTLMAEHRAVHEGDLTGAAAEMKEVEKDSVSYQEALRRIDSLKNQAAYFALTGDVEQMQEKLAEMSITSSALPKEVSETLIQLPKKPGEVLSQVRSSEGLDAEDALKAVGKMHEISLEAREKGVENTGVADVYAKAMELKKEKQVLGQKPNLMELLGSESDRNQILKKMSETTV